MRLLRLRLAAVRGIDGCEVEPSRRGITLVTGRNESGKTTLAEAFELLLDKRADSTDRTVRRLQPVGTDAGSEVEAELETGPYRLRIFKRFNRNRETVLQVLTPAAEDLSGREAHDRLQEILAETVDLDLWRALRIEQGRGFEQAEVAGSRSLLQALEGAGHEGVGGEREESLREAAAAEYRRYFTAARGQPTGELKATQDEAVARRAAVSEAADELAHLEADVERAGRLRRRSADLAARVETARRRAAEALERLGEVEKLDGEVSGRRSALKEAEGRLRMLRELAESRHADAELAGRLQAAERELRDSLQALAPLDRAAVEAAAVRTAALEELERAKADERLAEARRRRGEITARRERAAELAQRREELEEKLARHPVTEAALRDLEIKDRAREKARAALDAASAGLRLEALAALRAEIDGETVELAAGESVERRVSRLLTVTLPEMARAEVTPGRDLEALRAAAERSDEALTAACEALGVESFEAAREAHATRRELEAERAALAAELRVAAGGADPERLAAEAAEAERAVEALLTARSGESPPPESPPGSADEAAERRRAAEEAVAEAEAAHRRVAAAKAEGEAAVAQAREVQRELAIESRHARERVERARRSIGELLGEPGASADGDASGGDAGGGDAGGGDRDGSIEEDAAQLGLFAADPRPALDGALAEAERQTDQAREELAEARRRLAAEEPAAVRRTAEEAREELERLRGERRAVDKELNEVRGRLEVRGESGLFEREAEARSALAAAERRARSLAARAAAARKLYEALETAREEARDAYSEPLRRAIEEIARPLFGSGFAVELDDELRIARRTLDGTTLELERLSAGAREQLALVSRLACARLAAPAGGVPLVLDDALGHTDRERLAALGEVLGRVAEEVQVIVLTSEPDRFASVAAARTVRIGGGF